MREIVRELSKPNGFNPRHLLIANLDVNSRRYKELDARIALFKQATEKLRNLPEVESAAVDSCVPMGCFYSTSFAVVERPSPPSQHPSAGFFVIGPDYFHTMQIPLIKGRKFSFHDDAHAPIAAIVNQEFARRFFPKENAVGKQIEVEDGNHKRAQIVGIVGNVSNYPGEITPQPQVYECYLQIPVNAFSSMALIVRSRIAPTVLAATLRHTVWSVDKEQPVGRVQTMQDLIADNLGGDKLLAGLIGLFAGLALVLAAVGYLWPYRVFRDATNARDWNSSGARRSKERRAWPGAAARRDADGDRMRYRHRSRAAVTAPFLRYFQRVCRAGTFGGCRRGVNYCTYFAACHLCPGAPCGEG